MAHDRKFRFGVQTAASPDGRAWREKARKIEALGYSTLYMPDHFVDTELAPMVGIAVAAEATETLRIGTLVLGNDYKHPAVVAKEFATLDVLSGGRVEAGIGAG
ncbi:MAG TPA: LLM class flavin-dependent oxidoreductase, partial [Acidimicrobiia bacterium]